ncbi:hypothetical protein BdWA1_003239 [Babesia duncani]|uniref:Uncharacterized protein n=1 Tax=Babesia duncani TaxID=323732 RepID=A0AAD9UMZ6_9APIC|nr:hypothetical protein BdWA1_003239 [Babesia duncani]
MSFHCRLTALAKSDHSSGFRFQYRNFGVSGSYGSSIYGVQTTAINARLNSLPEPKAEPRIQLFPRIFVSRWPGNIRSLRAKYFFREGQATNTGYYHMLVNGKNDYCFVSNPNKNATCTRTIENTVHEQTRGFTGQILLHGRGVKAYFEPSWPNLMIRLGVGSSVIDATRCCTMYAKHVKIDIDRTGSFQVNLIGL